MKQISSLLTLMFLLILANSLAACGSSSASAKEITTMGDPTSGQPLFMRTCAICHGREGQGLPGLGKNLAASEFVAGQSDQDLVEFIKVGRTPADPFNTTGVLMPPKGGRANLTDQDLYDIVTYIRTIQK